jgi:ATP-dependent Zn protease
LFNEWKGGTTRGRGGAAAEKATAYHEAGHAVIGYLVGETLEYITIIPTGDAWGHTVHKRLGEDSDPAYSEDDEKDIRLENVSMMHLAGRAAEELFSGAEVTTGSEEDTEQAIVDLLYIWPPREIETQIDRLRAEAKELLQKPENWHAIEILSRTLLDRRRLDGPEACNIVVAAIEHFRQGSSNS